MPQAPSGQGDGGGRAFDTDARDTLLAIVSKFEGNYWSLNLDGEFEGRFDQPMRDAHGERIPVAQRPAHPDFSPNPLSKYGSNPGHVGLSFGFIQFTQDGGNLGKLLSAMLGEDEAAFRSIFGAHADELVRVTNLSGDAVPVAERKPPPRHARRSPRVAPIGGNDLWESPWRERFIEAGKQPVFQRVQRQLAAARYLDPMIERVARPNAVRSQKGLCVLLDRAVQLGVAGCQRLVRVAWGPTRDAAEREAQSFRSLYRRVEDKSWAHRVERILESQDLSFELQYDI